jgi:flagellar biosynthesis protein FlhA
MRMSFWAMKKCSSCSTDWGRARPKLIEDLVPKLLPMSVVVKVLQYLLLERVPIRNLRTICETLAELAPKTQDPVALVAAVRVALGRSIVQNIGGLRQELPVITLDPALEQVLQDSMASGARRHRPDSSRALADRIQTGLADSTRRQEAAGEPAVLLVAPKIRRGSRGSCATPRRRSRCLPTTRFRRTAASA